MGTVLTATLTDADVFVASSVRWQWARENTSTGQYEDISGATSGTYTAMTEDGGSHLRATARYNDGYRTRNTASDLTENPVTASAQTLVEQYDVDKNNIIDREEARAAVDAWQRGTLTKEEARLVVGAYFRDRQLGPRRRIGS